eukprot:TRINITY_DN11801_c0_g1_i7.p1 TRINITY_DN11801_c0_g1~~TRINITY_DN11801_c0_g1_i7.p1  ORF type:complete len:133 (-),score=9.77 TRINITY_DN11801_c0_g1_i7:1012-1410(-)
MGLVAERVWFSVKIVCARLGSIRSMFGCSSGVVCNLRKIVRGSSKIQNSLILGLSGRLSHFPNFSMVTRRDPTPRSFLTSITSEPISLSFSIKYKQLSPNSISFSSSASHFQPFFSIFPRSHQPRPSSSQKE